MVYSVDLDVFIEIGLVNSYSESQPDSKCGANTDLLLNVLLQLPQGDIDLLTTLTPQNIALSPWKWSIPIRPELTISFWPQ